MLVMPFNRTTRLRQYPVQRPPVSTAMERYRKGLVANVPRASVSYSNMRITLMPYGFFMRIACRQADSELSGPDLWTNGAELTPEQIPE